MSSNLDREPALWPDAALLGAVAALSVATATHTVWVAWTAFGLLGLSRSVYLARWGYRRYGLPWKRRGRIDDDG